MRPFVADDWQDVHELALNGMEPGGHMDVGHVILSEHQDDDIDREALGAIVDHVFARFANAAGVVTHNASDHAEQLAPLRSLGFTDGAEAGELLLTRERWEAAAAGS